MQALEMIETLIFSKLGVGNSTQRPFITHRGTNGAPRASDLDNLYQETELSDSTVEMAADGWIKNRWGKKVWPKEST